MGPFALPVPGYRLGIHTRKPKRRGEEWDVASPPPAPDDLYSHLPSGAINPRSHPPDLLRQFAVAGLAPEKANPADRFPLFPHKALPPDRDADGGSGRGRRGASRSGAESSDAGTDFAEARADGNGNGVPAAPKHHSARLRHLSTVTAILHRCLGEGDIPRARRAFGLLVRTREVDVRLSHLWAVGSEILMRDGEGEAREQQRRDQEAEAEGDEAVRRWSSAANVDRVRAYFESLIQQHPHDPHRPHLTSALDFWPVLFGIEIYNIDAEFGGALRRLAAAEEEEEEDDDDDDEGGSGLEGEGDPRFDAYAYAEDEEEAGARGLLRRRGDVGRRRLRRAARDELRRETAIAAQQIAARMDQLMENAPYSKHLELLRLRGMLALFVGDLHLPTRLIEGVRRDAAEGGRRTRTPSSPSLADDLLLAHADGPEERSGVARRGEELEKAKDFFSRIVENGGALDGWAKKLVEEEEGQDDDEAASPSEDGFF
ncbi:hypothetical protein DL766_009663 [Monosporascus sp. MC13-8B]|uniref:Uncharacterized protein n=1 Tax=Monosporascus cannonballus TaxID=155416 RepID=A0ABY0HF62_9PEZI|nr:hypothetical protein DL763_006763 [Monosporascus cannonballus]RYO89105.1 hypothetical protein DL762_003385 [Monosporascus cannonballus]RYP14486.1 hypothetical protein DL766_009663 [Monosporascus sp. MC13-8B]